MIDFEGEVLIRNGLATEFGVSRGMILDALKVQFELEDPTLDYIREQLVYNHDGADYEYRVLIPFDNANSDELVDQITIDQDSIRIRNSSAIGYCEVDFSAHFDDEAFVAEANKTRNIENKPVFDKMISKLGKLDVELTNIDDSFMDLAFFTPSGEDFVMTIQKPKPAEDFAQKLARYADNFDPEEYVEDLIQSKREGQKGIPGVFELCEDAKDIKKFLDKMAKVSEKVLQSEMQKASAR